MDQEQIFSKKFSDLDHNIISDEISKNGFFCCEGALESNFLNNINKDVADSGISMNTNNVAGVYFTHGNQFFITHMLAVSKSFFNYCTNNKILDICSICCSPPPSNLRCLRGLDGKLRSYLWWYHMVIRA